MAKNPLKQWGSKTSASKVLTRQSTKFGKKAIEARRVSTSGFSAGDEDTSES